VSVLVPRAEYTLATSVLALVSQFEDTDPMRTTLTVGEKTRQKDRQTDGRTPDQCIYAFHKREIIVKPKQTRLTINVSVGDDVPDKRAYDKL